MSAATAPCILFPHIAKTGGTAVLHHFRRGFGPQAILVIGPHNRVKRFFAGEPQPEHMEDRARAAVRVVQGHGADENAIGLARAEDLRLMVVLRDPVSLARSRYNQRASAARRQGRTFGSTQFMRRLVGDPMTGRLLADFPSFIDPRADTPAAQALSVLRCFDYVVTTNDLGPALAPMFAALGLPPDMERRRVADDKIPLQASDDDIRAANPHDVALYQALKAGDVPPAPDGRHINPLGFDAQARARAMARLSPTPPNWQDGQAELIATLCQSLRAEAALAFMTRYADRVALPDPVGFGAALRTAWETKRKCLTQRQLGLSAQQSKRMLAGIAAGKMAGFDGLP